jgi:hypothetical protein
VDEALVISIENLRHGWVDVRVTKGTCEYFMRGVSYVTDFTGDLALAALGFLFRSCGGYGVWLDGEGEGWVLRLIRSEAELSKYLLQCGRCESWSDAKLLMDGGEFNLFQAAHTRYISQAGLLSVQVDQSEFGHAVMSALQGFQDTSSENGVIPCDQISQVNRPIAALGGALGQPFKTFTYASDPIATVQILPIHNQAAEQTQ